MVIIVNLARLTASLLSTLAFPAFLAAGTPDSVTLLWNPNLEPDLAGYRLHYGTALAPYASQLDVTTTSATVSGLKYGATYTFAVSGFNTAGEEGAYSASVSYTVGSDRLIPSAALANISTRAFVRSGENVMIGGFIVDGIVPKKVALRALGPSLAGAGISGAMRDPFLQVVDASGGIVASNDNWNTAGEEISSYGIAPSNAEEAALVVTLAPGSYSAIVSDQSGAGGVGLFELYDVEADLGRVANISTRSRVESGDNVMIGGFILSGTSASELVVRAIGPSLSAQGVSAVLADPTLEIYDAYGNLIGFNDNWRSTDEADIIDTGVPPTDDRESAIVTTLFPGAYSSIVRGANGTAGVALVEVYALN
jgi:hypothetical protein